MGEFGTIRPTFGCKSQDGEKDVTTEALRNRKFIFTPGPLLREMIQKVSIQKLHSSDDSSAPTPEEPDNGGGDGGGEAPDPTA